ncbi:MAG: hypothetical protein ACYTFI_06210 [Planctomycetota bacterium]|jgi:hypothetical protein
MRYSYAWEVTPTDLFLTDDGGNLHGWPDAAFVAVQGTVRWENPPRDGVQRLELCDRKGCPHIVQVRALAATPSRSGDANWRLVPTGYAPDRQQPFVGRVQREMVTGIAMWSGGSGVTEDIMVELDATASRLTGASVAGLVVGAMGVFVFGAALRQWLNRRRVFGAQAPEGDT